MYILKKPSRKRGTLPPFTVPSGISRFAARKTSFRKTTKQDFDPKTSILSSIMTSITPQKFGGSSARHSGTRTSFPSSLAKCMNPYAFFEIIPGTQMTPVLTGKDLVLEGSTTKIEDKQVPGICKLPWGILRFHVI